MGDIEKRSKMDYHSNIDRGSIEEVSKFEFWSTFSTHAPINLNPDTDKISNNVEEISSPQRAIGHDKKG